MDFALTDDQKRLRAAVRDLVRAKIAPDAPKYMDGAFPWDNLKALAEIGVLGMAVPAQYGGRELPVFETALVLEEIARGCYPTAMAVLGEVGTQTRILATWGPDALRARLLPKVVNGDCILSICMTEPHAGTDVAAYTTNAVIDAANGVARVSGVKSLISRAEEAGLFVVFTRIDGRPGRDGIGCALVEGGAPGLTLTGKSHSMGGEYLHEVTFADCEIPIENLVLREDGFRKLIGAFNTQRCLNPSISLGLAEGALDASVKYAKEREAFGRPIGNFQGMRWKLAEMYRDIEAARSLLYRACATANPFPEPTLAAAAKMTCNEMAIRVTNEAVQVHGGFGYTDECVASRLYRAARYGSLGGGTTETLKDLVGRRLMAAEGEIFG